MNYDSVKGNLIVAKISIIVPIYNVEKYLKRCVDSILNQSFKDYELILVNDGSTDSCGKICDEYKKLDDRVRVIHKKNGGLSDARNVGIDYSECEFVSFIDSDDYIAEDMYEVLYNNLENENADISVCGYYRCLNGRNISKFKENEYFVVNGKEALKLVLEDKKISVEACTKIYRKSLFNDTRYPIGKLSEDAFTTPTILSKANIVVGTTAPKYYYEIREDSITNSVFKKKDLNVIEAYKHNFDLVMRDFPDLKDQAVFRYYWAHACVLKKMVLSKDFKDFDEYNKVVRSMRKGTIKIIKNPLFSKQRKFSVIVLLFSKKLYNKLVLLNNNQNMNVFYN